MKTVKIIFMLIPLLLIQNTSIELLAQNRLDSLLTRCQADADYETHIENYPNGDSAKIIQIVIEDNKQLSDEFLEAFKNE
jgi:hypothetical protein